jgi:2-dehydro-3-deoxyphosphogluconate aldolase/(4S)-4-hydroxy-2-oxoglutarate aldolase
VVAVARRLDWNNVVGVAEALVDGGVLALELTLNEPEATALRALAVVAFAAPGDLELGAGTILSREAAQRAVDAGATYLVMPHLDVELVRWAAELGIPAFPGCATPTEVLAGWRAGASAVKIFPASVLGPTFVRELRGPLPHIPVVPSGGITPDSAPAFIEAGAIAVGVGGWLLGDGQAAGVRERAGRLSTIVAAARAEVAG